jgi:predicted GIY-YIG superfamily endonuclease
MHWVYVLKSSQTGCIYVGETTRLYRRWDEHQTGRGGINTSPDNYDKIIGLYKVCNNSTFLEYYEDMTNYDRYAYKCQQNWGECEDKQLALELENHITRRYFYEKRNTRPWDVCGGSYTSENIIEGFCFSDKINKVLIDRPLCYCGYPCEVNMKKDKTKIYFNCPVPDWIEGFDHDGKCDFWKEFEPYRKILEAWQNRPTAQQLFSVEI